MNEEFFKLDRTALSKGSFEDESDEKAYWLSRTPEERLTALEYLRRLNYGYDVCNGRMQKVIEVVDPEQTVDC
ncbi:MAG: hypothetical protein HW421_830 [Ignavibacteria bacterium]|nr:hypothetical protein [Ignavibacteria bacterium]